jgi:hypothetical protein
MSGRIARVAMVATALGTPACYPATTRPSFLPEPNAAVTEVKLDVPHATRAAALALDADSIPVTRTEPKDGWLETGWFDAVTLKPTDRRPLGSGVVKVRLWVDPSRPHYSNITVETVFRPLADPSRGDRELEEQVPVQHRVSARILVTLAKLAKQYGGEPVDIPVVSVPDDNAPKVRPALTPAAHDSATGIPANGRKPVVRDSGKRIPVDSTRTIPPDRGKGTPPTSPPPQR